MRIIRVDDDREQGRAAWWVVGGVVAGLVAGVLLAERTSGRGIDARTMLRRARRFVEEALRDEDEGSEDAAPGEAGGADAPEAPKAPHLDERVLEAFANDPVLAERAIEIEETAEAGILLHGQVQTAREVAHAVTIARGVPGVTGVKQRLRVRDRR